MQNENKFLLMVGDDEKILAFNSDLMKLREQGLNFSNSPSIGAVYEIYAEDALVFSERARERGYKAGVYGSLEKARGFFWKALGFSADGNLDIDDLSVIETSTS